MYSEVTIFMFVIHLKHPCAGIGRSKNKCTDMNRILVIEDELPIRLMLKFALSKAGFEMIEAGDRVQAELLLQEKLPDLILMDWMLPDASGIDMVRQLKNKKKTRTIPIFMLTAMSTEDQVVQGLNAGADDYVTKPFSPSELIARIKATLRRKHDFEKHEVLRVNQLSIDKTAHSVSIGTENIELGPTEFNLLTFLIENKNRSCSRDSLLNQVWSRSTFVEERTVDVHILRLRRALSPWSYDKYIETVRGIGYQFVERHSELV